jgi:hypothetical protein
VGDHGVRALPGGVYGVRLAPRERELVEQLSLELERLLADGDPATGRLFPPAHEDDPEAEREYRALVGDALLEGRLSALRTLRETARADRLDQAQADAWCGALNDLRLVLGERLGVTEELTEADVDPRNPEAAGFSLYAWLTWLQADVVDALAARLGQER